MSINRRAARKDANQDAVIEALEGIGCLVYVIRQPVDLLIGYEGTWIPAEVKDGEKPPSRRKLRPIQEQFLRAIAHCLCEVGGVLEAAEALLISEACARSRLQTACIRMAGHKPSARFAVKVQRMPTILACIKWAEWTRQQQVAA